MSRVQATPCRHRNRALARATSARAASARTLASLALIASAVGCSAAAPQMAKNAYTPSSPDTTATVAQARYRTIANTLPRTRAQRSVDDGESVDEDVSRDSPARELEEMTVTGELTGAAAGGGPSPAAPAVTATTPGTPAAGPTGAATTLTDGRPDLAPKLIIEGWLTVEVDSVPDAAAAIRAEVEGGGGSVVSEQLSGAAESWYGSMQLKLPPGRVDGFLDWLAETGEIKDKRIQGTDVSRTLYDQKIALENLELTLNRLRALLDHDGLQMQDILAIEREMTRLDRRSCSAPAAGSSCSSTSTA